MFLHAGASLHGHEYSHRQPPAATQRVNRRSPLLHPPFSNKSVRTTAATTADSSTPAASHAREPPPGQVPHTRRRPEVCFQEPERIPGKTVREYAESTAHRDEVYGSGKGGEQVKEDENGEAVLRPQPDLPMSDDPYRPPRASTATAATAKTAESRRSRKPGPRKATRYLLAYPAPRFAGKRRVVQMVIPKIYLQLQQVSAAKRPMPVIDVFPSTPISGPAMFPRLSKRFPRMFGARGELGSGDIVLVKSEDYDLSDSSNGGATAEGSQDEHSTTQPNLVAIFSQAKKSGFAEIVLSDGTVWVAKPLPSGSFDFVHTDSCGHTTTARWARRAPAKASAKAPTATVPSPADTIPHSPEPRFTFSMINPLSRRHPVMATLTQSTLDVQDDYTPILPTLAMPDRRSMGEMPAATLGPRRPLSYPGPGRSGSLDGNPGQQHVDADHDGPEEPSTRPVDDATKTLITVTATWLAIHLGWSPYCKPSTPVQPPVSSGQSAPSGSSSLSCPQAPASTDDAPAPSHTAALAKPSRRCTWNGKRSTDGGAAFAPSAAPRPKDTLDLRLPRSAAIPASFARHTTAAAAATDDGSAHYYPHPPASPSPSFLSREQQTSVAPSRRPAAISTLSGERSVANTPPPPPPPRRATSNGTAFMRRHLRLRSSTESGGGESTGSSPLVGRPTPASDHPPHANRGRGRRILSGDWGPAFHRHSSLHRTPTNTIGQPPDSRPHSPLPPPTPHLPPPETASRPLSLPPVSVEAETIPASCDTHCRPSAYLAGYGAASDFGSTHSGLESAIAAARLQLSFHGPESEATGSDSQQDGNDEVASRAASGRHRLKGLGSWFRSRMSGSTQ